jgi:hypothetical protein
MTVIHYSGNFVYHTPERNNVPKNTFVPIDPNLTHDEVMRKCGFGQMASIIIWSSDKRSTGIN